MQRSFVIGLLAFASGCIVVAPAARPPAARPVEPAPQPVGTMDEPAPDDLPPPLPATNGPAYRPGESHTPWWLNHAPDDVAVFSLDFTAQGTGAAVFELAADDRATASLDGQPVEFGHEPNFHLRNAVELGSRLGPGAHHLEITVVNSFGKGVPWHLNPAGVAFAIDERDHGVAHRIARSGPQIAVEGHAAFVVCPDSTWTNQIRAPWVWRQPMD